MHELSKVNRLSCAGTDIPDCDHYHSRTDTDYGYKGKLTGILEKEFPQLQSKVYADHAGATLYTKTQVEAMKQVYLLTAL